MQSTANILIFFVMCLQQASVSAGKSVHHFSAVNASKGYPEAQTRRLYKYINLTVLLDCEKQGPSCCVYICGICHSELVQ